MGRIWSSGSELNTNTSNVEFTSFGSNSLSTDNPRSGTYSIKVIDAADWATYQFASSNTSGIFYFRFYVYIVTSTNALRDICSVTTTANARKIAIKINTDNTLELWNIEDSA